MKICEYGMPHNNSFGIYMICKKNNSICTFVRYCVNERCLKMTSSYSNCKERNKNG